MWSRATDAGAICGLLVGELFNFGIVLSIIPKFWGIHGRIRGLAVNSVVLIVVSLLTKLMDKRHVHRFATL